MGAYQLDHYKQNKILTASPGEILIAMYDGAIRFAREAQSAIENRDISAKAASLNRLLAVLSELSATLDPTVSEQLCSNLLQLYDYMASRAVEAGATMEPGGLDDVIRHLQGLRDAWRDAAQQETAR